MKKCISIYNSQKSKICHEEGKIGHGKFIIKMVKTGKAKNVIPPATYLIDIWYSFGLR